jgi:hypothetical protein
LLAPPALLLPDANHHGSAVQMDAIPRDGVANGTIIARVLIHEKNAINGNTINNEAMTTMIDVVRMNLDANACRI